MSREIRRQDEMRKGNIGHNPYVGGPYIEGPPGTPLGFESAAQAAPNAPVQSGMVRDQRVASGEDAQQAASAGTLSAEEIAELRTLLARATPGPWSIKPGSAPESGTDLLVHVGLPAGQDTVALQDHCMGFVHRGQDDAALIVAAINALPELLDEIMDWRTWGRME